MFALAAMVWGVLRYSNDTSHQTLASDPVWSGIAHSNLPVLIVVGDHFFFGEPDSPIRTRDIRINSEEQLRMSPEFGSNPKLVFGTLSYLPKSVVFGLEPILPRAHAAAENVAIKLASELTSEDLHDYNIVFLGFIRSMGILRDYYLTRSNFRMKQPYLDVLRAATGRVFARSGPLPSRNTDYGLFARFPGPSGNQIVIFSGIGDVGVLATTRALNSEAGMKQIKDSIESSGLEVSNGWEVLLEADGHSRTDLDFRVLDVLPINGPDKAHHELSNMSAPAD